MEICTYRSDDLFFHHSLQINPDPDEFTMHAHDTYEVLVFLSGNGKMLVEGNADELSPGSVLLMRAGESHRISLKSDVPYERIGIRFDTSVLNSIDPEKELFVPFLERRLGSGNLFHLECLEGLLPSVMELNENSPVYRVRLTVVTFLFSLLLEAGIHHRRLNHPFRKEEENGKELGKNYEMIEYINHNLSADLSLDAISSRFYLSKSQLSRSFKKATGSTLWDYVLIKRLLLARSLIREGESISGACEKSGFKEYSSFYRAYKKRFGISPNQDRHVPFDVRDES